MHRRHPIAVGNQDNQLGLFRSTLSSVVQWEKLPPDTQEEVTALLVELLRGASPGEEQDQPKTRETNHE